MARTPRSPAARRRIRRIRITGWSALSSLLATIVGFLVWASTPYPEQPEPLRELYTRSDLRIDAGPDHIAIHPANDTGPLAGQALLFLPGARVNPHAYATSLADTTAQTGLSVVIVRPWWNLAIVDPRDVPDFQALSPDTPFVAVGGHSMGGVRACQLAPDPSIEAVVLMASYCATDLSASSLEVVSLLGSRDDLIDNEALANARALLPGNALEITIEGANHASFGDYGPQSGDGTPAITRDAAREALTEQLVDFLERISQAD